MEKLKNYLPPSDVNVVVYHSPCSDGFGSAYVFWKYFNDNHIDTDTIKFIPMSHSTAGDETSRNTILPLLRDKNVVFVDIVPPEHLIEDFVRNVPQRCVVLDHHKGMAKTLEKFPILTSDHIYFDTSHSGCMLAWQYCYNNEDPPTFLKLIEDRDIWGEQYNDTAAFVAAFYTTVPFDFQEYAKYENEKTLKKLIKDGSVVVKYQHIEITESIIPRAVEKQFTLNGIIYNAFVVNTNVYTSDVGALLSTKMCSSGKPCDFAIMWHYNHFKKVVNVSLRSDKHRDPCIDVSEIAKMFKGNGHTNAAGFMVQYPDPIDSIMMTNQTKEQLGLLEQFVRAKPFLVAFGLTVVAGVAGGIGGYQVGSRK
jgi:oligoribonuclease NrnB/cAMP/cGMP phosphodiesterase (DHH superfamily)